MLEIIFEFPVPKEKQSQWVQKLQKAWIKPHDPGFQPDLLKNDLFLSTLYFL